MGNKVTEIHQIELTTRCNLRCRYCPHPHMKRPKEDMEDKTFSRALDWVQFYYDKGTQHELSFTGIGEPSLHPNIKEYLRMARERFPGLMLNFSTNGLPTFDEDLARVCSLNNVQVFVSLHRPEMAAHTINLCKDYNILAGVNASAAISSFDWAGQVDWPVTAKNIICDYLKVGWGVILFDGMITTCCLDSENKGIIASVNAPPRDIWVRPYELCKTCHMKVPDGVSG